jgi:hypothetical protein
MQTKNYQNDFKTHYRYLEGYNKAKLYSLCREQGDQHAGSSFRIVQKNNSKMNPKPTAATYRVITKAKLVSLSWARGRACWIFTHNCTNKNFKMNPKPTAGTYRVITKPKYIHFLVG